MRNIGWKYPAGHEHEGKTWGQVNECTNCGELRSHKDNEELSVRYSSCKGGDECVMRQESWRFPHWHPHAGKTWLEVNSRSGTSTAVDDPVSSDLDYDMFEKGL
jgi:hypothetical protein